MGRLIILGVIVILGGVSLSVRFDDYISLLVLDAFVASVASLHILLLWPHLIYLHRVPAADRFWNNADYVWLILTAFSLITAAGLLRLHFQEVELRVNEVPTRTAYEDLTRNVSWGKNYYCSEIDVKNVPDEFREMETKAANYVCNWYEELAQLLPQTLPDHISVPKIDFRSAGRFDVHLSITMFWVGDFNALQEANKHARDIAKPSDFEGLMTLLWPFALAFSVALRLTKVTALRKKTAATSTAMTLEELIDASAQAWPSELGGDPNLGDVSYLAKAVLQNAGSALPQIITAREVGLRLVEIVEGEFIRGGLIRTCDPRDLGKRAACIAEKVQADVGLGYDRNTSFVVSLFTWHGCISMAKLLRGTYVTPQGVEQYTEADRLAGYQMLKSEWEGAEAEGNPWVRYGVSLASLLATKRGDPIVENWVPSDSPYWR